MATPSPSVKECGHRDDDGVVSERFRGCLLRLDAFEKGAAPEHEHGHGHGRGMRTNLSSERQRSILAQEERQPLTVRTPPEAPAPSPP